MLSQAESNILVCVGLALPHFLYAAIWFFPQLWMAVFRKRSVEAFETLAWALKGAITAIANTHMPLIRSRYQPLQWPACVLQACSS
jgi:hypothetical protein